MLLLAAPDKFRGTLAAPAAAAAMAAAAAELGWTCTQLPLADGGEGTLDAFGGANRSDLVTGPLGEPCQAAWRLDGDLAVIEMARASGLTLVGGAEANDPMRATSRGTGELIVAAVAAGARRVIVGVGGSACTDGGAGAIEALSDHSRLDGSSGVRVTVAADVRTRFLDAAAVFAPQKGADADQVRQLAVRLRRQAQWLLATYGIDVTDVPGGGAAGGLAGGLVGLGARVESGFDLIAREVGLADRVAAADLVLTGEGRLDTSSFDGKVVGGVLALAARAGVGAAVVAGAVAPDVAPLVPPSVRVVDLTGTFGTDAALDQTAACVDLATRTLLPAIHPTASGGVRP